MANPTGRLEVHWTEIVGAANAALAVAENRLKNALVGNTVDPSAETRPELDLALSTMPAIPTDTRTIRKATLPNRYETTHLLNITKDALDCPVLPGSVIDAIYATVVEAEGWKLRLLCSLATEPNGTAPSHVRAVALRTAPDGWKGRLPANISTWSTEQVDTCGISAPPPETAPVLALWPALLMADGHGFRLIPTTPWTLDWEFGATGAVNLLFRQRAVVRSTSGLFRLAKFPSSQ